MNIPESEIKYLKRMPLDKLKEYIEKSLCSMPWEGFSGAISDRINEGMNYFYWLFSETIEDLQDKQLYRSEPQYLPEISEFLSEYIKEYGKFLDSEKSWNTEYLKIISKDKRFKLEDYVETEYRTFNEFFTRKVKPDKRPMCKGFVAPVDGEALNVLDIRDGKVGLKIKTSIYHDISRLTGKGGYQHGTLIDLFLDIYDYHRIHAPVDMKILDIQKISGGNYVGGFVEYLDGKYVLDSSEYGWQSIETRVVIKANNERLGDFCIVAVGMSHVGSIDIKCVKGDTVKKGDEIGLFKFGGSCVLIILQKKIDQIEKKHYLVGETLFEGAQK